MASQLGGASRTLAALALPVVAISLAWSRLGDPDRLQAFALMCTLAVGPAFVRPAAARVAAVLLGTATAVAVAFRLPTWEALPFRDQEVLRPLTEALRVGLGDSYGVSVPFVTTRHPEMESLMLLATFGFVSLTAGLVAARRPLPAAAVTAVGVCWPATQLDTGAAGLGALALAAGFSIPLALRATSAAGVLAGASIGIAVVGLAAWTSSAATFSRSAVLDWQSWDFRGAPARALGVRFVWDANYDGIAFPPTKTTVLRIEGPKRYWRAGTLAIFTADRWLEESTVLSIGSGESRVPTERLTPRAALDETRYQSARVTVKALVDDRLVNAGTPVKLEAPRLGTVFFLAGGAIRAQHELDEGMTYRIWSYAPEPSPAELQQSPIRYPPIAGRYLEVSARRLPPFGSPRRDAALRAEVARPAFPTIAPYASVYALARRVTAGSTTPYEAVLAIESWLRVRGGFGYDEQPPQGSGPPLVTFLTQTRAGYCQHFAGSMTLMLRLLGIPARVAVGFTSGTFDHGAWTVSDHDAHAWVEVWFPGIGWIPFDPTPGRGTFTGQYSYASESARAVDLLSRKDFRTAEDSAAIPPRPTAAASSEDTGGGISRVVLVALLATGLVLAVIGVGKKARRRARYAGADPRQLATASRRDLEAFLRDQGVPVPASATLEELARIVRDEFGLDASRFAAAAACGRFALDRDAVEGAVAARRELQVLLGRARGSLTRRARLRGFVSLRSVVAERSR